MIIWSALVSVNGLRAIRIQVRHIDAWIHRDYSSLLSEKAASKHDMCRSHRSQLKEKAILI